MAVLYRTEAYSGSLERRFAHVLRFELFELGNSHIFDELIQNGLVRTQELVAQMKSMVEEWEENGYVDDMSETDQLEFLEKVRLEISAQTGRNIQYALWLAEKPYIQKFYGGTDCDTEGYETSDIVLSNLGHSGILFGYELEPFPCSL